MAAALMWLYGPDGTIVLFAAVTLCLVLMTTVEIGRSLDHPPLRRAAEKLAIPATTAAVMALTAAVGRIVRILGLA